jgi:hypothetical protein
MSYDRFNSVVALVLGLASLAISWKSCQIAKDVQNDERQLKTLVDIASKQQEQIDDQRSELRELKNVDTGISSQAEKLSAQLAITQEQQKKSIDLARLERKGNIMRLRVMRRQLTEDVLIKYDYMRTADPQEQDDILGITGKLLEEEMRNPVLLESDSMLFKWVSLYSDLRNARAAFNTQLGHFETTYTVNGKEVHDRSDAALHKYQEDSYLLFGKSLNHFVYDFSLFMDKVSKEIKLGFM